MEKKKYYSCYWLNSGIILPFNVDLSVILNVMFVVLGILLLAIYIVGEYIGKIYLEVKERPKYFIERNLEEEK